MKGFNIKSFISQDRLLGFAGSMRIIMRLLAVFNMLKSLLSYLLALTGICNCQVTCVLLVSRVQKGRTICGKTSTIIVQESLLV